MTDSMIEFTVVALYNISVRVNRVVKYVVSFFIKETIVEQPWYVQLYNNNCQGKCRVVVNTAVNYLQEDAPRRMGWSTYLLILTTICFYVYLFQCIVLCPLNPKIIVLFDAVNQKMRHYVFVVRRLIFYCDLCADQVKYGLSKKDINKILEDINIIHGFLKGSDPNNVDDAGKSYAKMDGLKKESDHEFGEKNKNNVNPSYHVGTVKANNVVKVGECQNVVNIQNASKKITKPKLDTKFVDKKIKFYKFPKQPLFSNPPVKKDVKIATKIIKSGKAVNKELKSNGKQKLDIKIINNKSKPDSAIKKTSQSNNKQKLDIKIIDHKSKPDSNIKNAAKKEYDINAVYNEKWDSIEEDACNEGSDSDEEEIIELIHKNWAKKYNRPRTRK